MDPALTTRLGQLVLRVVGFRFVFLLVGNRTVKFGSTSLPHDVPLPCDNRTQILVDDIQLEVLVCLLLVSFGAKR